MTPTDWLSPGTLAWVAITFVLAGIVKGISGMGLPTLAMALLSLRLPAAQAAALMLLPALLTNVAQCLGPHWRTLARRFWPLWAGLALGTLCSPAPGLGSGSHAARVALGVVLVAYGLLGWWRPELPRPRRFERVWAGLAGLAGGVVSASTGVFVMPMVPFLQAVRLPRDELIQLLGVSFMVASLSLAVRLGGLEGASVPDWAAGAVALTAALAGMALGTRWRSRLAPLVFQRALHSVFLLLGVLMLARG